MPKPLPYHFAIRDLLRDMDPHVWKWFGQQRLEPAALEALKFDLLKSTYRLSRESHAGIYHAADTVADALQVKLPITLYQSQTDTVPNAGIAFASEEIHIVLYGKIDSVLNEAELIALLGHEFGHHLLHRADNGEHLQAWDALRATCLDSNVHPAFLHSFRKLCLYTEIFCDRVAFEVVGELDTVISMLVKVTLGASTVVAADFIVQAKEILRRFDTNIESSSDGLTHPEAYIRACAIELYHQKSRDHESEIAKWIEGAMDMATLDLLQQREVSVATRQLIRQILRFSHIQSDLMLSHARLYFEDFSWQECLNTDNDKLTNLLAHRPNTNSLNSYFCFVLLDFATADRELEELPLANALLIAEKHGLKEYLIPMARKEMKLRKNQIDEWDQTKHQILESTTASKRAP